jgi:hypothetical protein
MRSNVDFPEPLGPISPMRSPSEIVKSIFSNSGSAPNLLDIPCALMMGGKRPDPGRRIRFEDISDEEICDDQPSANFNRNMERGEPAFERVFSEN